MNPAIQYANENGVEALKDALPASFNPSLNESIVMDGVSISLADAFEVVAADYFVEKYNALPCMYDDLEEKARYFEIMAEVEA
jgi:hypothetical protein